MPALPVTLDELVTTARECEALGASVIHVHIRDDEASPTLDSGRLRETVQALRAETDLIVQLSSGGAVHRPGGRPARRARRRAGDGLLHDGHGQLRRRRVLNRWEFIVDLHTRMQERGIVPEYEIFDLGQLTSLQRLLDKYGLPAGGHVHVDFVMGVPGGMPGTTEALVACKQAVRDLPAGTTFSATGIGRSTIDVMLASLSAGGHLRVGMEDTITYAKGQPGRVEHAARRAGGRRSRELAQRPPLTTARGRAMLLGITRPVR